VSKSATGLAITVSDWAIHALTVATS